MIDRLSSMKLLMFLEVESSTASFLEISLPSLTVADSSELGPF